ncbi:hypothetical protein [Nostoc sp. WHI]|uniref:hypothetical protein n=1 Tax=Nostoc sp. WHI TaxID=2650611 RepID=UPI0018C582E2|nr:hypothetical protein [Nostoc sp. WHI]
MCNIPSVPICDRPTALLLKETLRERASYGRRWRSDRNFFVSIFIPRSWAAVWECIH